MNRMVNNTPSKIGDLHILINYAMIRGNVLFEDYNSKLLIK